MLAAFREPSYRRLWLAGFCMNTSRWMDMLVLGWVVLELTGSPFMVGVAAFGRTAPLMLFGVFSGVVADRFDRGRLLVAVQALNLSTALVLALLFWTGQGGVWQLIGLEVLFGIAWSLDYPVRRSVLYTLVGPGRVTNAASLEGVSLQGTKMIGPLLGGVLIAWTGPAGCYLVLALLFLMALLLALTIQRRVALTNIGQATSVLASLGTGLREARAEPTVLAVLILTILMNLFVFPYQQMWPVFARDVFRVGPELLGLLIAADGLGAMSGALVVASRQRFILYRQLFVSGALTAAVLVCGLALSPWYLLSLTIQFLIGMAEAGFSTMQGAIIPLAAPERSRGRLVGILSACIGAQPLGALWIGYAASHLGAPSATAISAGIGLLVMLPFALRLANLGSRPLGISRGPA
jgi:MFS family permease